MEKMLSIPVAKDILELEKEEAVRVAEKHLQWVLSGKISTWVAGRQLNRQEQLEREREFIKRNFPQESNSPIFVCLRCGESCYYSHLDGKRRLRPECERYAFLPRLIIDNKFLPAECKIHDDPLILTEKRMPGYDPFFTLEKEFEIIINGKRHKRFSEKDGAELFGKDLWSIIKMRNTLCAWHSFSAGFGPCSEGVKAWEKEKSLHPGISLPAGVEEQLEVVRIFRDKVDEIFSESIKKG